MLHTVLTSVFQLKEEEGSPKKQLDLDNQRKNKLLQKKKEKEELIRQKRQEMLEKHNVKDIGN